MLTKAQLKLLLEQEEADFEEDANDAEYNMGRISAFKEVLEGEERDLKGVYTTTSRRVG